MRTITIPIDLDTALQLLAPEPVLIELKATAPGVNVFVEAMRVEQTTLAGAVDPPPAPASQPVAAKAAPAKAPPTSGEHTCHCGRSFKSAQAKATHQTRIHGRAAVAAVPPLPPIPIGQSVTGPPPARATATRQDAPTRPSSMCDRGDHTMCKTSQARCNCSCHGRAGQHPPAVAAS